MTAPLLTEAEMRESVMDVLSPHYLDEDGVRLAMAAQLRGVPADKAIAEECGFMHWRRERYDHRPLADRIAAGAWRWAR